MAIKAGLVGVNPKGVDKNGMPIGSGGANVEAEIRQINLDIAQLEASKVGIGQLTANNKAFHFAYDSTSEKYGYKLDGTGDFIPFESAGGGPGWVKPAEPLTDMTLSSSIRLVKGGYAVDNQNVYVDIVVETVSSSNAKISGLPGSSLSSSAYMPIIRGDSADVENIYYGVTSSTGFLSPGTTESTITISSSYFSVGQFLHFVFQYPKA